MAGVNRALEKNGHVDSPFPPIDGRTDLRGLSLAVFIKRAKLKAIDFSGATREGFGQADMSLFEDCVFAGAVLDTNWGNSFVECTFAHAKMTGVVMRGTFDRCDFSNANLVSCLGDQVTFERCLFKGTKLRKCQLTYCHFGGCEFEEAAFNKCSLSGSRFIGGRPSPSQLADTLIERCVFED